MGKRYPHLELEPIDIDVMRGLSVSRYVSLARATRDAGYDPNVPSDRTRVLASLSYLRRRGLVTSCRLGEIGSTTFALTGLGESHLAGHEQQRLIA